jgi:hypothetical protein
MVHLTVMARVAVEARMRVRGVVMLVIVIHDV